MISNLCTKSERPLNRDVCHGIIDHRPRRLPSVSDTREMLQHVVV
jgi:hypothetical protein